jgi:hypothetical protein
MLLKNLHMKNKIKNKKNKKYKKKKKEKLKN